MTILNTKLTNSNNIDIIQFVEHILSHAILQKASDIHFEPQLNYYQIRIRIDGLLHKVQTLPITHSQKLTTRLKIMAKLDITEHRLPQDGRFTFAQKAVDIRVSTCPSIHGEKIVLRILENYNNLIRLDQLGLNSNQLSIITKTLRQPHGMILLTGPTGSGKTISIYSMLQTLNDGKYNICSVADPIEAQLPNIHQVNIMPKIDLDFARILRAFLRQDPDIITVGEIRDIATAQIAIKAAQTGHLLLSTLHTNSAVESIWRLINMGITPYQISNALTLVLAQRLLRKLYPYCKIIDQHALAQITTEIKGIHNKLTNSPIYKAQGCDKCYAGYKGRIGIFELLPINNNIRSSIIKQLDKISLTKQAKDCGMLPLRQVAINKLLSGITSLTEINRVTLLADI